MKNHFELQPTVKKSVDKLPVYVYSLFLNDRRISWQCSLWYRMYFICTLWICMWASELSVSLIG